MPSELVRTDLLYNGVDYFKQWFGRLVAYVDEHGHCNMPHAPGATGGVALGVWVSRQRKAHTKGTLSAEWSEQLGALGLV